MTERKNMKKIDCEHVDYNGKWVLFRDFEFGHGDYTSIYVIFIKDQIIKFVYENNPSHPIYKNVSYFNSYGLFFINPVQIAAPEIVKKSAVEEDDDIGSDSYKMHTVVDGGISLSKDLEGSIEFSKDADSSKVEVIKGPYKGPKYKAEWSIGGPYNGPKFDLDKDTIECLGKKMGFSEALQKIADKGELDEHLDDILRIAEERKHKLDYIIKSQVISDVSIGAAVNGDPYTASTCDDEHMWTYIDLESYPPIHTRRCQRCGRTEYMDKNSNWIEGRGY